MQAIIQPSKISGNLQAPASKSSMQRACAAAVLHTGETTIFNPGNSNDDKAAINVIQDMGAITENRKNKLIVHGNDLLKNFSGSIHCGESGLGIRMFAPLAALSSGEIEINGSGSLLKRPMDFFDEVFPQLQVEVHSTAGKLPIRIRGSLQPKDISIDGSLSSQFLTGLLFAFAKAATKPVTITVSNLTSRPYIDLTLQVMEHFGYRIENKNYESFIVYPGNNYPNKNIAYTVEGDWSGAAFLLVGAAITGNATITGLSAFSTQADKAVLQALMMAEAKLSIEESKISVASTLLKAFHFDANQCPDLFPPLVALAAYCKGTSVIEGVNRLTHKESNRALTLQEEFGKMGIAITLQDDLMIIKGGTGVNGANVHSHHDHRIAMACAVAALRGEGKTIIENADAVNKSYPDFFTHLQMLGADVSLLLNQ